MGLFFQWDHIKANYTFLNIFAPNCNSIARDGHSYTVWVNKQETQI